MNGKGRGGEAQMLATLSSFFSDKDMTDETEKSCLKNMQVFLGKISGDMNLDKPDGIEAMALALKRDLKWQRLQAYSIKYISDNLRISSHRGPAASHKRKAIMLVKVGLINVATKILKVKIPELNVERDPKEMKRSMIDNARPGTEIPWYLVHYYCCDVVTSIVNALKLSAEVGSSSTDPTLEKIAKSGIVEALITCVNQNEFCALTLCASVRAISCLCSLSHEASQRAIFSGVIHKLGPILVKDTAHKIVFDWANKGPNEFELKILSYNKIGLMSDDPPAQEKISNREEYIDASLDWSSSLQTHSLTTLANLVNRGVKFSHFFFKETRTLKAVIKWLRTAPLIRSERVLVKQALGLMATLSFNVDLGWILVSEWKIINYVENIVMYPYQDLAYAGFRYIHISTYPDCKAKNLIGKSETILRACALHAFSSIHDIRSFVLQCVEMFSKGDSSPTMLKYLGARDLTLLEDSFGQYGDTKDMITCIRENYKKYALSQWKKELEKLERSDVIIDQRKSEELKKKGNACFNSGLYEKALEFYNDAIKICPITTPSSTNHRVQWCSLLATLYGNRAQCYINLKRWQEAVSDCDYAIIRCLHYDLIDVGGAADYYTSLSAVDLTKQDIFKTFAEVTPILLKAMFRRSKALFELKDYLRAVVDAEQCAFMRKDDYTFYIHYEKVLLAYRDNKGVENARRCGLCWKGGGQKLKRCAYCSAIYCSRKCQSEAWDKGHKDNCGSQLKNN
ncbi:uncharacterized protein LOC100368909 [Saccoglossus kowalevskii]|uniref:Uncharacterized protein LOC100368909 n=1 Tax=Saccoglossus kowalevskii TaxID=10224 RepID=A0ABM0GY37_SACKO|nr:PREDICTED: uncharacterized protein LOC100368909 [Saccoglossus kowalevskii]